MYSALVTVAALVFAIGYLNQKVVNYAFLKWIYDNHGRLPGDEIYSNLDWAWKNMLGIR